MGVLRASVACLVVIAVFVAPATLLAQGRGTVTGIVTDASGTPLAAAVWIINADTQVERRAVSDKTGAFVFGGLTPGTYRIRVTEANFAPFESGPIAVAGGQSVTFNVRLQPAAPQRPPSPPPQPAARATLSGTVFDPDGKPIAATVWVINEETKLERRAVTGANGSFVFGGLTPGGYRVRVEPPGGGKPVTSERITLGPGEQRTFDVRLQRPPVPPTQQQQQPPPPQSVTREFTPEKLADFIPTPDRWRLEFPGWQRYEDTPGEHPFTRRGRLNPYKQNRIKGDYPVIGNDIFFVLTGVAEVPFEYRKVPTPGGVSTERPNTEAFFGEGEQYAALPTGVASFELFKGDAAFKPRDWAFRVTPVFNLNYVNVKERNVVNATPEEGRDRRREDFAIQEAFGEVKLFDVSPNYDFVSVRAGIQPFTSDFRGFLFRDTNLGVRAFGNFASNRQQWNVALFDQLEKETNSELNLTERRKQRVIIANYYYQDFLTPGYTISPSFHANYDDGEELFFDENGFLVRPNPIGLIVPHKIRAYYAGFGGDGHWGRLNITHQFYQAWGRDEFNGIAGQEVDINAQFAVVELSVDKDWWRIKGTFVYASGDDEPLDEKAKGFDAIFDNPNIAGGPFSFWNRQGIRLPQTLVGLVGRSSILPTLRSSKTEGQANFVNPGLYLFNAGWDAELTTKLRTTVNVNYLRFDKTEVLSAVQFQESIDKAIGLDYSVGLQWRPWLNDNVIVTGGASVFTPLEGFKNLLTSDTLYTPFVVLTLTY